MPQPNRNTRRHTVQDATILTTRSEWEVREAIHQGHLPAEVDGQQFKIRADDLAVWATTPEHAGPAS